MKVKHQPKAFKALRKLKTELYPFTNPNGNVTYLNFNKHLMLNRPYKCNDYMMEMINFAKQKMKMQEQKKLLNEENESEKYEMEKEDYAKRKELLDKEIEKEDNIEVEIKEEE